MRLWLVLCFISTFAFGQSGASRQALSRIQKGNWSKALQSLQKAFKKDSGNIEVNYVAAVLFASPQGPVHNIDTADYFLSIAQSQFGNLTTEESEKLEKVPINGNALQQLRGEVDSLAFEAAVRQGTENGYQHFITRYPKAKQLDQAIVLRDRVAFESALSENGYHSMKLFLERYPQSALQERARAIYDERVFNDITRDGRMKSFTTFVHDFPDNRYRDKAENEILKMITADGTPASFKQFLQEYPHGSAAKKARNILFHLTNRTELNHDAWLTDSLRHVLELNKGYWVPFLAKGSFGFLDQDGGVVIPPTFQNIHEDYLCGNVEDDFLVTGRGIFGRNQAMIYPAATIAVEDVGAGFLKVKTSDGVMIIHKSGNILPTPAIEDAAVMGERFMLIKVEGASGVISLTGLELLAPQYQSITSFDNWIVLEQYGKKTVVTAHQIAALANGAQLPRALVFDEVRRWADNLCWVRNGSMEGVIDESLSFVIPLGRQRLSKTPFGFLSTVNDQYIITGIDSLANIPFRHVAINGKWMSVTSSEGDWYLYDVNTKKLVVNHADTIWFERDVAFARSNDSVRAWISPQIHIDLDAASRPRLFTMDDKAWIVVQEKRTKAVYDALSGKKIFAFDFEDIEPLAAGFFLITKSNKKGVIDLRGKLILPLEYEAIVQQQTERLSLLKDKKLGLYDLSTRTLIKPAYERNLQHYHADWFVAFKNGAWGFIRNGMKENPEFLFEEVQYWNDTAAWVKDGSWKIYNFSRDEILFDDVQSFEYVSRTAGEHIVIVKQANTYGVLSNVNGVVIAPSFSLIINLGSAETPLYFAEKFIAEANLYVIVYYSAKGELLRREALEEEDYDRLVCTAS